MTEPTVPRDTHFWAKQDDLLTATFREAFASPAVKQLWSDLVKLMQDTRDREAHPDADHEARLADLEGQLCHQGLRLLARAMCEQSPGLGHALGPYLPHWLMAALAVDAFDDPWPTTWQQKQWRFLPDNPATLAPDGGVDGLPDAKESHHTQIRAYFKSLRPERSEEKGGRPEGTRVYTKEEFHAQYPGAVAEVKKKRGTPVTDEHIARALAISLSTLRRYLRAYGRPVLP